MVTPKLGAHLKLAHHYNENQVKIQFKLWHKHKTYVFDTQDTKTQIIMYYRKKLDESNFYM